MGHPLWYFWASLVAQLVKNPPAMQETWVWSLGWEDTLEKETATRSSILAWRIPWTAQSMGYQRAGRDWATFIFSFILTSVRWYLIVIFTCIFLIISDIENLFLYSWPSACLFWKNVYSGPLLIFTSGGLFVCLFDVELHEFFIDFTRYIIWKYFLSSGRLPFHFVNVFLCCAEAL